MYKIGLQIGSDFVLADDVAFLEYQSEGDSMHKEPLMFEAGPRQSSAEWSCQLEPNAKGGRKALTLAFELEDFGRCILPLNVKVYGKSDQKHAGSGWGLKGIIASFRSLDEEVKLQKQQWIGA